MADDEHILKRGLLWLPRQVWGFLQNAWGVITGLAPDDVAPPSIVSTWEWLKQQVPRAVGLGTPQEQLSASVVLAIAAVLTSLFTGGVTLFFVAVFAVTFGVGVLRLVPVVDDLWPVGAEVS